MKLYSDGEILGVAFKLADGQVFTLINPNRHDMLKIEVEFELGFVPDGEWGFYTKNIKFMNRFVARKYAKRYLGIKIDSLELTSDHLW